MISSSVPPVRMMCICLFFHSWKALCLPKQKLSLWSYIITGSGIRFGSIVLLYILIPEGGNQSSDLVHSWKTIWTLASGIWNDTEFDSITNPHAQSFFWALVCFHRNRKQFAEKVAW
jgi:hypothetical protein